MWIWENINWRLYSFQRKCLLVFITILIACKSMTFCFFFFFSKNCDLPLCDGSIDALWPQLSKAWGMQYEVVEHVFFEWGMRTLISGIYKNTFWWSKSWREGCSALFLITFSMRVLLYTADVCICQIDILSVVCMFSCNINLCTTE